MLRGSCGVDPNVCRLIYVPVSDHPTFNRLPRNAPRLVPLALHAGLSTDEQLRVFEAAESGTRKVIVSTNIAEVCLRSNSGLSASLHDLGQCDHRRGQICC